MRCVLMKEQEIVEFYLNNLKKYGYTPKGADWGKNSIEQMEMRYQNMLNVMSYSHKDNNFPTLLDVGCSYCPLAEYAERKNIKIEYTGIDLYETENKYHIIKSNFLTYDFTTKYDYVVCCGVLTTTFEESIREYDRIVRRWIDKMFALANVGIAFNIMKSQVDFMNNVLYYKSPLEILGYCMTLTDKFVIDSAYPLYEYTVYLYK